MKQRGICCLIISGSSAERYCHSLHTKKLIFEYDFANRHIESQSHKTSKRPGRSQTHLNKKGEKDDEFLKVVKRIRSKAAKNPPTLEEITKVVERVRSKRYALKK